jgi:uroporphyrin-III C-methyltransferase / precorrin-2 dehydrogenase / sirohydrochlorin ferrochelatase
MSGKVSERANERDTNDRASATATSGIVYLVGAGPGDPELLTLRAARLLREAEVVVYDRLVSPEILALVSPQAERIYAGKQAARHTLPQPEINRLLVDLAGRFQRVVRLKGGDPFVFGRGGEELEVLAAAGIRFEVVPGITAAIGCAAYTGIPLTHRNFASACLFVTGHLKDGELDLDWPSLAYANRTLVFYMGILALEKIAGNLVAHGLPATTPVAVVRHGTTPRQDIIVASLADVVERTRHLAPGETGLLIVGEVVRLRDQLAAFMTRSPQQLGM